MTQVDDELIPVTLALIDEFGMSVQFEVLTTQDYDSTVGHTTEDPTWVTRKIIPPDAVELGMIDGDLIQDGDQISYVAASGLSFTPLRNQGVDLNSASGDEDLQDLWTIVKVGPIRTGQDIAMYKLVMRN